MNRVQRVLSNISYNFLSQAWSIVLTLVTLPFIIAKLGNTAYGVYGMVLTVVGYFALMDMGMGSATVKFMAESWARQDRAQAARVFRSALFFYCCVGALGALLVAAISGFIVTRILNIPADSIAPARGAFLISAVAFAINMPTLAFAAVPQAVQRIDQYVRRKMVLQTLSTLAVVAVLALGYGLLAVVGVGLLSSITALVVYGRLARTFDPGFTLRPRLDREGYRPLMRFSAYKVIGVVSGQAVFQLDKLILGWFFPIAVLPHYLVPLGLAQRLGLTAVNNVTEALYPAMSGSFATDTAETIKDVYLRAQRLVASLVLPAGLLLILYGDRFLSLWISPAFSEQGAPVLRILTAGYVFAGLASIPATAAEAAGKPEYPAAAAAVSAVMNVVLCLVLIPRFGLVGGAAAVSVSMASTAVLYVAVLHRRLIRMPVLDLLSGSIVRPLIAAVAAVVPAWAVVTRIGPSSPFGRAPLNLALLIAVFGLIMAVYGAVLFRIGGFDRTDKERIFAFLGLQGRFRP